MSIKALLGSLAVLAAAASQPARAQTMTANSTPAALAAANWPSDAPGTAWSVQAAIDATNQAGKASALPRPADAPVLPPALGRQRKP